MQDGGGPAVSLVLALCPPSADHVVAGVDRLQQPRDFLGRILQVGVECHDHLAAALAEAGQDRGMLAEIARQLDHSHAAVTIRDLTQHRQRIVARTVVDEHHLVVAIAAGNHGA